LGNSNKGDPAKSVASVAALVTGGTAAADEAFALVEVQGGDRDPAACGDLTDGELGGIRLRLGHMRIIPT